MQIHFFAATNELLMHATREEYRQLALAVEQMQPPSLDIDQTATEEHGKVFKSIGVQEVAGQPLIISVTSLDGVLVRGDKQNLGILADNIRGFAHEAADHHHQHLEHIPDHSYIGADSVPTVLAFKVKNSARNGAPYDDVSRRAEQP